MKDLKQIVLDRINELGDDQAAEYFGKSKQTINAWKKVGNIPLSAVQQILNEAPSQAEGAIPSLPPPVASEVVSVEAQPAVATNIEPLSETQAYRDDVELRLTRLEDFARSQTDPDLKQQPQSLVRPASVTPTQPQVQTPAVQPTTPPIPVEAFTPADYVSPKMSDILRPRPLPRR